MQTTHTKWWGPQVSCFFLLWIGLLWLAPDNMLGDPGTLWHTVVGERILQTGHLVTTDPFSFTHHGQPWLAQQWLGEIVMALLFRLGGLDAVVLAAITLLAATYAWLAARFFRTGLPWPAGAVLIMLVIAASSYHFLPRPHLVTIALTAWIFAHLCHVEARRRSPRQLLIIPVVLVVWTNFHGGALGGVAMSALVLTAWIVWHHMPWARRRGLEPVAHPALIATAVSLSFVAVLINPFGPALPRVWLGLMNSDVIPNLIVEHAPMRILSIEGAMILTLAAVYLTLLATAWPRRPRVTWLFPILWLVLTFTRIRHGPLFAVTAAIAIAEMLPHSILAARLIASSGHTPAPATSGHSTNLRLALLPACAVLLALVLQANAVRFPLIGAGWSRLKPYYWPTDTAHVLRERIRTGQSGPNVFNDLGLGGFLIFAVPDAKIFIDDRCELYGDDGLLQYKAFLTHPERIDAFAADEGIDLALTKYGSPFDRHFAASRIWSPVYHGVCATVYERINEPNRGVGVHPKARPVAPPSVR